MTPFETVNACSSRTAFALERMEDDEPMVFYTLDYAGSPWSPNAPSFVGIQEWAAGRLVWTKEAFTRDGVGCGVA